MDFERLLACLLAALAVNQLIHSILEVWGVRARLPKMLNTILWHGLSFVGISGIFFGLFITLNLSIQTLLVTAIFVMVIAYAHTTIAMDAYYAQVGRTLRGSKKD